MAVGVYFRPDSMTTQQYDETLSALDAAGLSRPAGRVYHTCFGPADNVMIFDVWESQQAFEEFGKALMPILQQLGLDAGAPDVMEIHNMIF